MPNTRKIITFALALIVPISLISGYFCYTMPPVAQAATGAPHMSHMPYPSHMSYASYSSRGQAVAPCCLTKSEKNQEDATTVAGFSFDNVIGKLAPTDKTVNNSSSATYAASFNYPISPPPIELLASVIKIE